MSALPKHAKTFGMTNLIIPSLKIPARIRIISITFRVFGSFGFDLDFGF